MTASLASPLSQLYSGMSGMLEMCQKSIASKKSIVINYLNVAGTCFTGLERIDLHVNWD